MDILLMTDHLRKLSEERHGARRRAFAGSGLAILAFALSAMVIASINHEARDKLPLVSATPTMEDAR